MNLKIAPHSREAEMSVLGGLMMRSDLMDDVAEMIGPEDFFLSAHQVIFRAMLKLSASRQPLDLLTVRHELEQAKVLEDIGGISYLASLAEDAFSIANTKHYAEIVRTQAIFRRLIDVGSFTAELGYKPEGRKPDELVDVAEQSLSAIREKAARSRQNAQPLSSYLAKAEDSIHAAKRNGGQVSGLSTGYCDLDRMTTGLHPGDLVIIAGRPSMGKTTLALNIAENVSLNGKRVLVFSMEMPGDQLAMRSIAGRARVPLGQLRSGQVSDMEEDSVTDAASRLNGASMLIDDSGSLSPLEVRARARRAARTGGLGLIVIDYVQLMHIPGYKENRTQEMAEISRSLKALAKELGIPIILLSQLNRGVENRDVKRPRMADLRESGGLEQDADLVAFVYRDEVYDETSPHKGVAEIIIGKQRNGALGTVELGFFGQFCRFENYSGPNRSERLRDAGEPEKPRRGFLRSVN